MTGNITEASLCPVKIGSDYVLDVHGVWLYCSREELEKLLRLGSVCKFRARTGKPKGVELTLQRRVR
jgi:hypothetical protein